MTLSSVGPKSRLRSEVDELSSEVTFVLRHVLIERRGQSGIIPSGSLGVVIDKVDSCSRGQTHLPSRRERTELTDGLRLDRQVALAGSDDPDELLSSRVHPGGRSSVVVHKVWSTLGSESLFPASGQRSSSGGSRVAVGTGNSTRRPSRCSRSRPLLWSNIQHVISQSSLVVSSSSFTGRCSLSSIVGDLIVARSVPGSRSGVVVDIVLTTQMIDSSFPTGR